MRAESIEGGEKTLARERDVSGFNLGGVALGHVIGDGAGGETVRGELNAVALNGFIDQVNARHFHRANLSGFRKNWEKQKPPRLASGICSPTAFQHGNE